MCELRLRNKNYNLLLVLKNVLGKIENFYEYFGLAFNELINENILK
jgi:hypothetical protein